MSSENHNDGVPAKKRGRNAKVVPTQILSHSITGHGLSYKVAVTGQDEPVRWFHSQFPRTHKRLQRRYIAKNSDLKEWLESRAKKTPSESGDEDESQHQGVDESPGQPTDASMDTKMEASGSKRRRCHDEDDASSHEGGMSSEKATSIFLGAGDLSYRADAPTTSANHNEVRLMKLYAALFEKEVMDSAKKVGYQMKDLLSTYQAVQFLEQELQKNQLSFANVKNSVHREMDMPECSRRKAIDEYEENTGQEHNYDAVNMDNDEEDSKRGKVALDEHETSEVNAGMDPNDVAVEMGNEAAAEDDPTISQKDIQQVFDAERIPLQDLANAEPSGGIPEVPGPEATMDSLRRAKAEMDLSQDELKNVDKEVAVWEARQLELLNQQQQVATTLQAALLKRQELKERIAKQANYFREVQKLVSNID